MLRIMVLTKIFGKLVLTNNAKNYGFDLLSLATAEKSLTRPVNVGS